VENKKCFDTVDARYKHEDKSWVSHLSVNLYS
jgi:hypothetical protein